MRGQEDMIREAMRKLDLAEKRLIDLALKPDNMGDGRWRSTLRRTRRDREDAVNELIEVCRKFLKPFR
jgi:hypothetical protein